MPRPTLLQSLLQQPTTKYSQDYNYASPATSLARRTRASASDAGSVYSLDSDNGSLYSGSPSIKSSKSLGASPQGRRGKRKTSRSYGNYLAEDPYSKPIRRAPSVQSSADSARTRRRSQVSVRDMDVGYQPPVKELPETPPPDQQTHEESFASPVGIPTSFSVSLTLLILCSSGLSKVHPRPRLLRSHLLLPPGRPTFLVHLLGRIFITILPTQPRQGPTP